MTSFRDEIFNEIEQAINNGENYVSIDLSRFDETASLISQDPYLSYLHFGGGMESSLSNDLESIYEEIEAMVWTKYHRLICFEGSDEGSECSFIDPIKPENDQLWEDWKTNVHQALLQVKERDQSVKVCEPKPMLSSNFAWLLKQTKDEKLLSENYDIDHKGLIFKTNQSGRP